MATATLSQTSAPAFGQRAGTPKRHAPTRSSPLAAVPVNVPAAVPLPSPASSSKAGNLPRPQGFATSRPLRPFASINTSVKKPVKIIEPPESFKGGMFVLNLTQAEFSRQE